MIMIFYVSLHSYKQLKTCKMRTIKNYQVQNTITNELSFFDTLEHAQDFVGSEIKWYSSKHEIKTNTGYDESDFPITENFMEIE